MLRPWNYYIPYERLYAFLIRLCILALFIDIFAFNLCVGIKWSLIKLHSRQIVLIRYAHFGLFIYNIDVHRIFFMLLTSHLIGGGDWIYPRFFTLWMPLDIPCKFLILTIFSMPKKSQKMLYMKFLLNKFITSTIWTRREFTYIKSTLLIILHV